MIIGEVLLIAATLYLDVVHAKFNFTTCPAYWEVQNWKVAKTFNMSKMVGTFYEQALHDYTQYPTCLSLDCVRSQKVFTNVGDGKSQLQDTFTLTCFGQEYIFKYFFNKTENNGAFIGYLKDVPAWWHILFAMVYPDTIIDFKESEDGGQYEWVIEFQCRDKTTITGGTRVEFTGFNFYSRQQEPGDDVYNEMIQAARDAKLSVYMDHAWGLKRVNQSNCNYSQSAIPQDIKQ
jgi:hypothetical protein